jgi:hypothetical protein
MKFRSDMYKTINYGVVKVGEIRKAKDLSAPLHTLHNLKQDSNDNYATSHLHITVTYVNSSYI